MGSTGGVLAGSGQQAIARCYVEPVGRPRRRTAERRLGPLLRFVSCVWTLHCKALAANPVPECIRARGRGNQERYVADNAFERPIVASGESVLSCSNKLEPFRACGLLGCEHRVRVDESGENPIG